MTDLKKLDEWHEQVVAALAQDKAYLAQLAAKLADLCRKIAGAAA